MTAEIVIMNTQAVALAADSAVTTRRGVDQKIFSSANKLFALSKNHDVGIMVYGNSSFMNIPWETIIKLYRKKVIDQIFGSIEKCCEDFLIFLGGCNKLISPSVEKVIFREAVFSFLGLVKRSFVNDLKMKFKEKVTPKEVEGVFDSTVERIAGLFQGIEDSPSVKEGFREYILGEYKDSVKELIKTVFEELPISKKSIEKLNQMSIDLCCKFPKGINLTSESGVIIAGFGDEEAFPVLKSFIVGFAFNGVLKYRHDKERIIGGDVSSTITPFAQTDPVAAFMNGIDPERGRIERGFLTQLFKEYENGVLHSVEGLNEGQKKNLEEKLKANSKEKLKEHWQKLQALSQSKYVQPVMNVIRMLPKDELAVVAETFINLASFKKRVTMESETVGGPIDVAVISKGDGFVWIKRKYYFARELNPQFFARYSEG